MLTLDEFIEKVAEDAGGVLLIGADEATRRSAAARIHARRGRGAIVVVAATAPAPRFANAPEDATLYVEDATSLTFEEQETLLQKPQWKVIAGAEARYELHDAVSEERLRPAVYHLVSAHFYDFDKNLAAVAKR